MTFAEPKLQAASWRVFWCEIAFPILPITMTYDVDKNASVTLPPPKRAAISGRSVDLPVETTSCALCPVGPLASLNSGEPARTLHGCTSAFLGFTAPHLLTPAILRLCWLMLKWTKATPLLPELAQDKSLGRVWERWKEGGVGNEDELFF